MNATKVFFLACVGILTFSACNYKFFVKKENVITEKNGYLMIIGQAGFFVETKDSTYNMNHILNKINDNVYWFSRINSFKLEAFKRVSKKIPVTNLAYDPYIGGYDDTLYYCFCKIEKFPGNIPNEKGIKFQYLVIDGEQINIRISYCYDNILTLHPALKNELYEFNSILKGF